MPMHTICRQSTCHLPSWTVLFTSMYCMCGLEALHGIKEFYNTHIWHTCTCLTSYFTWLLSGTWKHWWDVGGKTRRSDRNVSRKCEECFVGHNWSCDQWSEMVVQLYRKSSLDCKYIIYGAGLTCYIWSRKSTNRGSTTATTKTGELMWNPLWVSEGWARR